MAREFGSEINVGQMGPRFKYGGESFRFYLLETL